VLQKEENMNYKGTYIKNGSVDSAEIRNCRCFIPREFAQKKLFFVQGVLSYRYMKILVKYTLACLATQVSLAAWLTNIFPQLITRSAEVQQYLTNQSGSSMFPSSMVMGFRERMLQTVERLLRKVTGRAT